MSSHTNSLGNPSVSYPRSGSRSRPLQFDTVLIVAVGAILLISAVMVASASISIASKESGDAFFYLKRQLVFIVAGAVGCGVVTRIPSALWEKLQVPLLLAAFVMLVLVLVPGIGSVVNGSRRWIHLPLSNFQPSELARLFILIFISGYVVRKQKELKAGIHAALFPLGVLAAAAVLLLAEPDMGAATVLVAVGVGLLFLGGMQLRYFFMASAAGLVAMTLLMLLSEYRWKRVTGFIAPFDDPFGKGFQLVQSLIAIGRGELFGVGLGASVQKLFYLPEAHTDFVFAVIAEEFGFIGVLCVLSLFGLVVWRSLRIARAAAEASLPFQAFVAAAFGMWVGLQACINIGINMGVLPTKGLTLPMLSNGGSSLLVSLAWLGMVLRIGHEANLSGRSAMPREKSAKVSK
ncbi:MAG: putative lipid II flippase FtsW [Steroidobacteraceae bacterium]